MEWHVEGQAHQRNGEQCVAFIKPSPATLIPFTELTWHLKSALCQNLQQFLPCLLISAMLSLASNKLQRRNKTLKQKKGWWHGCQKEKAPIPMHKHQVQWYGPRLWELDGGVGGSRKDRRLPSWGYNAESWRQKVLRSTFPLSERPRTAAVNELFYHLGRGKGEIEAS